MSGASLATRGYVGGSGGGAGETTPPVVTAESPDPTADPGEAGGFSTSFSVATDTEIVLLVEDSGSGLEVVTVSARFVGEPDPVVYRDGLFRGEFVDGSSQEATVDGVRLRIRRDGGWPGTNTSGDVILDVVAVDADGNSTLESFYYKLPAEVAAVFEPVVEPDDGALDHAAEALDRLPAQFR